MPAMKLKLAHLQTAAICLIAAQGTLISASDDKFFELPDLHVSARHTANVEPAATYAAPVTRLELNPQIDLQARNLAEAQGDVTIRGGIFENTGFQVGAANILDPQTGHYVAELPIAPEMLTGPQLLLGADNAAKGFNSSVGTISYSFLPIETGGSVAAGFGDNNLNYQRLHVATAQTAETAFDSQWGFEFEASRSQSAGTVLNGDHDFNRYSARLQRHAGDAQTDLFFGYQAKYLAWPELYAAPFGSPESDNIKTTLVLLNHAQSYDTESSFEASAYYRRNADHYLFNRFSTDNRSFVHDTEATAAAIGGQHRFSDAFALNYSGQVTADQIESTRLENSFTNRTYYRLSILPEFLLAQNDQTSLALRAGASYDDTNRDSSKLSPLADLVWQRSTDLGDERLFLSLTQTTQVAGYTAIGGGTSGLFASNPNLRREVSRNIEIGGSVTRAEWSLQGTLFYRFDEDLVDWTYSAANTSARSANNVDIDTLGLEAIASRRFGRFELLGSYTYLDKSEDYATALVDASFYALNYAEHRLTAAAIWNPSDVLQIRLDNEWRDQRANAIREGSDTALFTNLGISLQLPAAENLELHLAVENLWDDDFQEIPGTPGRGRQTSLGARVEW